MANNCCICGKKLGLMSSCYLDADHKSCDECFAHIQNIYAVNDENMDVVYESRGWIENRLQQVDESTAKLLKARLEKSKELDEERKANLEKKHAEEERKKAEKAVRENFEEKVRSFKTTTGYNFEGYKIVEYKNVVNGEIVLGTGFFNELNASISDIFGTSASGFSGKLSRAKNIALNNLIKNAMYIGANALIGIDFDIMTIGNNMIVVSVNGTAVVIEKL